LYLPKRILYGEILAGDVGEWEDTDPEEDIAAEKRLAQEMKGELGALPFIDLSEQQLILCECGCVTDPLAGLRQPLSRSQ
jgi:hypothetical protein